MYYTTCAIIKSILSSMFHSLERRIVSRTCVPHEPWHMANAGKVLVPYETRGVPVGKEKTLERESRQHKPLGQHIPV